MTEQVTENQIENRPWLWKKGQSGNPKGRPKGKTLKEYCREYLSCMTDREREDFLDGLPKELIWKMAEGNPKQDSEVSGEVIVKPIYGGISRHTSDEEGVRSEKED